MRVATILLVLIILILEKSFSQEGVEHQLFVNVSEKNDTLNLFINLYLSNNSSDTIFYPIRPGMELRDSVISSWTDNRIFWRKRPKIIDKKMELPIRFEFPYISHGEIDSFYTLLPGEQVNVIYNDNYYCKKKRIVIQFDDRVVLGTKNLDELSIDRYINLDDSSLIVSKAKQVKEYKLYQPQIHSICYRINISSKSKLSIVGCSHTDLDASRSSILNS